MNSIGVGCGPTVNLLSLQGSPSLHNPVIRLSLVQPRHSAAQQRRQAGKGRQRFGGLAVESADGLLAQQSIGHCDAASSAALLAKYLCMRHTELSCWAALVPAHLEQAVTANIAQLDHNVHRWSTAVNILSKHALRVVRWCLHSSSWQTNSASEQEQLESVPSRQLQISLLCHKYDHTSLSSGLRLQV